MFEDNSFFSQVISEDQPCTAYNTIYQFISEIEKIYWKFIIGRYHYKGVKIGDMFLESDRDKLTLALHESIQISEWLTKYNFKPNNLDIFIDLLIVSLGVNFCL